MQGVCQLEFWIEAVTLLIMAKFEAFEIRKTLGEMKAKLDFLRGSL